MDLIIIIIIIIEGEKGSLRMASSMSSSSLEDALLRRNARDVDPFTAILADYNALMEQMMDMKKQLAATTRCEQRVESVSISLEENIDLPGRRMSHGIE